MDPRFKLGDKFVAHLLTELDMIKAMKQVRREARLKRCEQLIREIIRLTKDNRSDHLLVTTAVWILVSLIRLDSQLRNVMIDSGVPGLLSEVLRFPHVTDATRAYSGELCSALCSSSEYTSQGSIGFQDAILPELSVGLEGLPELLSDSISATSSSQSLAKFVPYQFDPISYDSMQNMFPKRAATSHAVGGSSISRNRWANSLDEDESIGGGASLSIAENSSRGPRGDQLYLQESGRRDGYLPRVLKGRGPTHENIMQTPYVSPEVMRIIENSVDGRQSKDTRSERSKNAGYIGQARPYTSSVSLSRPHPGNSAAAAAAYAGPRPQRVKGDVFISAAHNRHMSRTAPIVPPMAGRHLLPRKQTDAPAMRSLTAGNSHEDPYGSYYSGFSYNPSANFADMTSSLAQLDPLCLNLSVGLHRMDQQQQVQLFSGHQGGGAVGGGDSEREFQLEDGARESVALKAARSEPIFDVFTVYGDSTAAVHSAFDDGDGKLSNLNPGGAIAFKDSRAASALAEGFESDIAAAAASTSATEIENKPPQLLPKMASEYLIHTEFMRHLFVDGATVQQTQDLIFKMQGVFEVFDKECKGVVSWNDFTTLLLSMIPERIIRADAVNFISAQAEDPNGLIDYREFCMSGKVIIIETKERDEYKRLATTGWHHRQSALTGDPTTYTWKKHVEWFRDRKSVSLVWLMRRASRAVLSFGRHILAKDYLLYQGERARSLGYLMECGRRSLQSFEIAKDVTLEFKKRALQARKWMMIRDENQLVLQKIGKIAIRMVEAENEKQKRQKRRKAVGGVTMMATTFHVSDKILSGRRGSSMISQLPADVEVDQADSDDEEEIARRQAAELAAALKKTQSIKTTASTGYGRIQELHFRNKKAAVYLKDKGMQAIRLMFNKEDAVKWLHRLGYRATRQDKRIDSVQASLIATAQFAVQRSIIFDDVFLSLRKTVTRARAILDRYVSAQENLHKIARHSFNVEDTLHSLTFMGQKWLRVLNQQEHAYAYMIQRRVGAFKLVKARTDAIEFLQSIPRRIFANADRVDEAERFLFRLGRNVILQEEKRLQLGVYLKGLGEKSVKALQKHRRTWAELQQMGENARRTFFESHWMVQSYNKSIIKEEEGRVASAMSDAAVIRRGWTRNERLRAELEDVFVYLGMRPQKLRIKKNNNRRQLYDDDDDDLLIGANTTNWQIGRLNFRVLTMNGKFLGGNSFNADFVFNSLDTEGCGYITFDDIWEWIQGEILRREGGAQAGAKPAAAAGGGFLGRKVTAFIAPTAVEFALSDILPQKDMVIIKLFEKYEGRHLSL